MFDLSISEIAIIVIIAIVVIGPKELPRALATAGRWMAKARGVMGNFRTGFDAMVREAELQEMEKKWASENERIMLEHPTVEADEPQMEPLDDPPAADKKSDSGDQPDLPLSGDSNDSSPEKPGA
ncbi:Sec-independent protein translocase protein TatB [Parasphingorhabdus cellanae]|uniref:Twin-arginine translocase subunit TatB n=1 Tax=Parasphingorhabdus cellanae TaxID=2806553 RepID=A0ABX7T4X9_9SPHN|nr:Sec-independent protein translocase protein TatB [Parasphingorhabdus cellanae]QTD55544.1 twin-arginine translocase subunit TatB [Parasphingorhabdus cellanae]